MDQNFSNLKCKTITQANMLVYRLIISDGVKSYSVGSYETPSNALKARMEAEDIIKTAKSETDLRSGLAKIHDACDVHVKKNYLHIPRRKIPSFNYQNDTGCYYAKLKNTGYNLGTYTPYEIDIGKQRLDYMWQLIQDGHAHKDIDKASDIFCKIQRQEHISLESFAKRVKCANSLILGICSSNEDGAILSDISPLIDTILISDFNLLTEQDFDSYNYIVLFNFDEHPYPQPDKLPDLTHPYFSHTKIITVSNRTRKEDVTYGTY